MWRHRSGDDPISYGLRAALLAAAGIHLV